MKQVVLNLVTPADDGSTAIGTSAKTYLGDVDDSIAEMLADCALLSEMCQNLQDSHQRMRDKRMNDTLFILGVISAIFLPGQFVTGLYGMNFVKANGDPN